MFQEIDNLKSLGEGSFLYFCKGSGVAGSESWGGAKFSKKSIGIK